MKLKKLIITYGDRDGADGAANVEVFVNGAVIKFEGVEKQEVDRWIKWVHKDVFLYCPECEPEPTDENGVKRAIDWFEKNFRFYEPDDDWTFINSARKELLGEK